MMTINNRRRFNFISLVAHHLADSRLVSCVIIFFSSC